MSSTVTETATATSFPLEAAADIPRGPVTATLSFYSPPADGAIPYNYVEDPPKAMPKSNYSTTEIDVTINDIRGRESAFELDRNAFATVRNVSSKETAWTDDAHIREVYYPEVEQLILEQVPGAQRVLLFDHTIRRASPNAPRGPVTRTHIDQTPKSAAARVQHHLPDEADTLLRGRYRIINIWRPINGSVASYPLAVADATTVRDEDLVAIEHRYPDRTGETAGVRYTPAMQWYYWSGVDDSERLLLQCYDSENPAGRVPHSAFVDPRSGPSAKPRESIEVRALVFG